LVLREKRKKREGFNVGGVGEKEKNREHNLGALIEEGGGVTNLSIGKYRERSSWAFYSWRKRGTFLMGRGGSSCHFFEEAAVVAEGLRKAKGRGGKSGKGTGGRCMGAKESKSSLTKRGAAPARGIRRLQRVQKNPEPKAEQSPRKNLRKKSPAEKKRGAANMDRHTRKKKRGEGE